MAIPVDFNNTEQLQALVRRYLNKEIREHFRDLNDAAGNWDPDISTTRGAMRYALTHLDNDTIAVTILRMLLYYFVFGQAKSLMPDIFGLTKKAFDATRKYHPTITLNFLHDKYDPTTPADAGEGEISIKLMDETSTSITKAQVNALALKIKNLFATPRYVWHKGKPLAKYKDLAKGYELFILTDTATNAKLLIEQVLDIQGDTPNWKYLSVSENQDPSSAYPVAPGTQTILGETADKPRFRRTVDIKFSYATLALHGKRRGITLVDTTGLRKNPVEKT